MKKASLTVFLSLSLSIFLGFSLFLIETAIKNQQKLIFHGTAEMGMDSVLGEYSVALKERYGLFYIDTSYLQFQPSVDHLKERLQFYLDLNMTKPSLSGNAIWGKLVLEDVQIVSSETAAAGYGLSLNNQAVRYAENSLSCQEAWEKVMEASKCLSGRSCEDKMAAWSTLMDQLSDVELPEIVNDNGEVEEIPLNNPADGIYGLSENDLLFLCEAQLDGVTSVHYPVESCMSVRGICNVQSDARSFREDPEWFMAYLYTQMGSYGNAREESVLSCQMEYLLGGRDNDFDNLRSVIEEIFLWRMYDNTTLAFQDDSLSEEAHSCAAELPAVSQKTELEDAVAESILYACAYLESVSDLRSLLHGGSVPLQKTSHHMSVDNVKDSTLYCRSDTNGLSYAQYLMGLLLQEQNRTITMRAMDIMEMDVRSITDNPYFCIDYCVERFQAEISAMGAYRKKYQITRKYGYF